MKKQTVLSLLAGMLLAFTAMATSGAQQALAQNPLCCDFIVNTSALRDFCFPLAININWSNGAAQTEIINTPGFSTFHIPNCPPAPTPTAITVASGGAVCCYSWNRYYCGGCLFIEFFAC